ncbi:hypothetical protein M0R45_013786 [Rubus argutus]|uniref:Uncharacterized protein n=1 Tax=Rubus argutus TaxID=59490 RepID=A0AAW1XKB2_RUBAR
MVAGRWRAGEDGGSGVAEQTMAGQRDAAGPSWDCSSARDGDEQGRDGLGSTRQWLPVGVAVVVDRVRRGLGSGVDGGELSSAVWTTSWWLQRLWGGRRGEIVGASVRIDFSFAERDDRNDESVMCEGFGGSEAAAMACDGGYVTGGCGSSTERYGGLGLLDCELCTGCGVLHELVIL